MLEPGGKSVEASEALRREDRERWIGVPEMMKHAVLTESSMYNVEQSLCRWTAAYDSSRTTV